MTYVIAVEISSHYIHQYLSAVNYNSYHHEGNLNILPFSANISSPFCMMSAMVQQTLLSKEQTYARLDLNT
jgi:hypothetical protein